MKSVKKKKKLKGFKCGGKDTNADFEGVMTEIAIMKKLVSIGLILINFRITKMSLGWLRSWTTQALKSYTL